MLATHLAQIAKVVANLVIAMGTHPLPPGNVLIIPKLIAASLRSKHADGPPTWRQNGMVGLLLHRADHDRTPFATNPFRFNRLIWSPLLVALQCLSGASCTSKQQRGYMPLWLNGRVARSYTRLPKGGKSAGGPTTALKHPATLSLPGAFYPQRIVVRRPVMAVQKPSSAGGATTEPAPRVLHFNALPVRICNRKGEIWFAATDVCTALKLPCLARRKDKARRFRLWITHHVLPLLSSHRACTRPIAPPVPSLSLSRQILSQEDLSFRRRDASGQLLNWTMPRRKNNWHEHYGIGETWFGEIVELARHNPRAAYHAMRSAGSKLQRFGTQGHLDGFVDRMARWALAAILTNSAEPRLPFKLPRLGMPPREGMAFHLAAAVPRSSLTPSEQSALDRRV